MPKLELPAINIQWPFSSLILSGQKTIETRVYPIPKKYLGKKMLILETPGKEGNFRTRIQGTIIFSECFLYPSQRKFYSDQHLHFVTPDSEWRWKDKKKWGWVISEVIQFSKPIPYDGKKGIIFTNKISID